MDKLEHRKIMEEYFANVTTEQLKKDMEKARMFDSLPKSIWDDDEWIEEEIEERSWENRHMSERMKERWRTMNDYFDNVTPEQLKKDSEKAGMFKPLPKWDDDDELIEEDDEEKE